MNIQYDEIYSFKRLNLPDILQSYGNTLKSKGLNSFMGLCPFHEDKNPSLSITQREDGVWLWHCFACRFGGTVIDFMMKKENLTLQETYAKLKQRILPQASINGNGRSHSINTLDLLKTVAEFYHKSFYEDKRGSEYLKARGIVSLEIYASFKIGFVIGSLRKILSERSESFEALKDIGILNSDGNEIFYHCVVIPLVDEDQNIVGLYGRHISRKQHLYLKGPHKGLINSQGAFNSEKVILTESVIDALSLYELGVRNVIPCYGTGGFTDCHKEHLLKQRIKTAEICFDNDAAGARAAEDLSKKLQGLGIKSSRVTLPDGIKDLNDFLLAAKTKEDFEALPRHGQQSQAIDGYEVTRDKDVLHLKIKAREYRVRTPEENLLSHLRVNIKLSAGEKSHIDILDLYSQRQRSGYARRISKEFNLTAWDIEQDLDRMITEIESAAKTLADSLTKKEAPMSDEEKEEALKSLRSPTLMEDIVLDLGKIGCVGEESSKLLGYLVTISRRLDQTLSMIIVSQSGAGKSNLADTLESIIPKDECVHLSRITPQALYYMEKDSLKRKVLIIEEKEGSEQADYSLRVLQSKQVLRLAVPMKDPMGKPKTVTFEVEGPVVLIETTTRSDHNPENTSRCFVIYMDESESQTKRIHDYQRKLKTLEGAKFKKEAEAIRRKHQNMQKLRSFQGF